MMKVKIFRIKYEYKKIILFDNIRKVAYLTQNPEEIEKAEIKSPIF